MNKASLTLICFIIISSFSVYAQSPLSVEWLNNSKGSNWDLVSDMVIDKENNIYLIGNYKDTIQSDKRLYGNQEEIFIAKFNSAGDSIWQYQLKSDNYRHIKSIFIGESGQTYICGYKHSGIDKDSYKSKTRKETRLFIEKLDENGEKTFFADIIGNFKTMPIRLIEKNDKGILLGGSFTTINYNDSTYKSDGKTDIFLYAFDVDGKPQDFLVLKGYGENTLNDIKMDLKGNTYLTGAFERELKINTNTIYSKGRSDSYLIKLDPKLKVEFIKQQGGIYSDYGKSIEIDTNNNVFITGNFSGRLVLQNNDTLVSKGKIDVFISKYNESGNLLWNRSFGGIGNEYLSSCILNNKNDIYLNGSFRGDIEKGNFKIKSAGFSSDVFVAKFTNDGEFRFIEAIGDTNTDFASRIVTDSLNYIYITGNFNQSMKVIGDTTELAAKEDFYLTKLYDCDFSPKIRLPNDTSVCENEFVIIADSNFAKYLWNETTGKFNYTADTTGTFYLKAYDEHGCITVDSIYVQINEPLQVDLGEDLLFKVGDLVYITTNEVFEEYLWSTAEKTPYIEIVTDNMEPGKYPIDITTIDANGCKSDDKLILEIIDDIRFSVFPTPTKSTITLQIQNIEPDKKIDYQLVSEAGSVVIRETHTSNSNSFINTVHTEKLEPGVYYLKVRYDEIFSTLKIIKL